MGFNKIRDIVMDLSSGGSPNTDGGGVPGPSHWVLWLLFFGSFIGALYFQDQGYEFLAHVSMSMAICLLPVMFIHQFFESLFFDLILLAILTPILLVLGQGSYTAFKTPEAASSSNAFSVTNLVVAKDIDPSSGTPLGVATTFHGARVSVVGYAGYTNGKPGADQAFLTLSGGLQSVSCTSYRVQAVSGNFWCKWDNLGFGKYTIAVSLNARRVKEISFSVSP
jgi:hypothetical protein